MSKLLKIVCKLFGHHYPKGCFSNARCLRCGEWAFNPEGEFDE